MPKLVALLFLISVFPMSGGLHPRVSYPKPEILKPTLQDDPPPTPVIISCKLTRRPSGVFDLTLTGTNIFAGAFVSINGVIPKKVKFKDPVEGQPQVFTRIVAKGRVCKGLPGIVEVRNPGINFPGRISCNRTCSD